MLKRRKSRKALRRVAALVMMGLWSAGCWLPGEEAVAAAAEKVLVKQYVFAGETMVAEPELASIVADSVDKDASLAELEERANLITQYLRKRGYIVAFAYVPPQDFSGGTVKIAVEPGRYDEIIILNTTKIHERAIRRELGKVQPGAIVEQKALERAVLLIGDLANAEAKTSLQAGKKSGTTTLIIDVKPKGKEVSGYVGVDNGGYRYTGRYEWSALVNRGNIAKEGDLLSASLLFTGQGQTSGSFSYSSPFWQQGNRWGISYARSQYSLGGPFAAMGATGTADTLSLSYEKNYLRSRNANFYASLRFDSKRLNDDMDVFNQNSRKSADNWVAGVRGDWQDAWQGGGFNTYSFNYTYGDLNLKDEVSRILDSPQFGGYATEGNFGKYNFNFTRQQTLRDRLTLYLSYAQQWSNKNLDSSEKMSLGGPYAVRAYPRGEASGDQGWLATAELRWNLPQRQNSKDTWQLIGFIDGGSVQINKDPNIYTGDNRRTLSGWGVGVNWSNEDNWAARLHYARKLGSEKAVSDTDKNGRVWLQLYKFF